MLSDDPRKNFILTAIEDFFQFKSSDHAFTQIVQSEALNNFLDNRSCFILTSEVDCANDENRKVLLLNKVESIEKQKRILIFVKIYPNVITPDNLKSDIFISSISDTPINALYHSVKKIFAPVLLKNQRWSEIFNPNLQKLLCDLEAGLGTVVRSINGQETQLKSDESLAGIQTPLDECRYWADLSKSASSHSEKDRGKFFYEMFKQLQYSFTTLDSMSLAECKDLPDVVYNVLDEIWKQDDHSPPYPQSRMIHLMDIIGNGITLHIQKKLAAFELWNDPYSIVEDNLQQGIDLCETWQDACQKLTTLFWPNFQYHTWKNGPFIPKYVIKFSDRLHQILLLRAVHHQLMKLLNLEEQNELGMKLAFDVFKELNPLQYNSYTDEIWKDSVQRHEDKLIPAERRVANKLRIQLRTTQSNALQLMQEFKRYEELIRRPGIRSELTAEREILLGQLVEYVATIRQEFSLCIGGGRAKTPRLTNTPEVINNIVWVRQLEKKMKDIRRISKVLLEDLSTYQTLSKELEDTIIEFEDYHKEQFGTWSREIQIGIKEKSLSLDTDKSVLMLDEKGQPSVNYSPRLVSLMREVRQLRVLGYNIPSKIQDLDEKAKVYYSQAKELQQIVNFYKTIADHMILSQQPMMLEAARSFTYLVNEKNTISWDDPQSLDSYISKLQEAVERLSRENRMLRKHHFNVCEMVLGLMSVDLFGQQQKWKDSLNNIRTIMARLQDQGFSSENMRPWKAHWDRQLYKTLEHQYQLGIETLNENLAEIKVEVIYRNCSLQFRPPIEEIRARYYSQLRKFLSIPVVFKGVNDVTENLIFAVIMDRNSQDFLHLYKKAEHLFKYLEGIKNKFKEWVAFGSLNMEDFVEKHCLSLEHWKTSFKIIKAKSQEFSKLQLEDEKIDCITVSYAPIKAYVDYLLSELDIIMVKSLRRSIQKDSQQLEEFLTDAINNLTHTPQSVTEIAEASKRQMEYHTKKDNFLQLYVSAQEKNEFLGKWSRNAVVELSSLQGQWDMFERIIDDHSEIITQQMELLKAKVATELTNFEKDIERFSAHWHQLKPNESSLEGKADEVEEAINIIKEKRAQFDTLLQNKQSLLGDIQQFGLPEPDFSAIDELETDIVKHEQIWFLFEEFNTSLQDLSTEEWILFRNKVHHFEIFLNDWTDKLRKCTSEKHSAVTVMLQSKIDKYKDVLPLLKYCRGDVFSPSHWADMFGILNIPNTPVEKLLFEDFLRVKDTIINKAETLKELNNRAQGEVIIREALNELDIWSTTAKFSLTDHEDSQGNKIALVKEWKDLLNKVGDNRCLLQSLKDSPYYEHFADRASIWENRLTTLDTSLQQLNQVQRKWVYLEPILGRGALPSEQCRFQNICQDFRSILQSIKQDDRILSLTNYPGLLPKLNTLLDQLNRCQKALNQFLEEKRSLFPRFYFLGDEDLLEILGQATKPNIIQSHLKKLFAGIHAVEFDENFNYITAMKSSQEEIVPLHHKIHVTPDIEIWLGNLEKEMKSTLKLLLKQSLKISNAEEHGGLDPSNFPSQILCLTEQILFTQRCEKAIETNSLNGFLDDMKAQLDSYTNVDLSESNGESNVLELKLKALVLDTIHAIDVIEYLIEKKVRTINDWHWQKQLRFYLKPDGVAVGRMVDAEFLYTYEYQGNAPKLVHTPLTDKCYLTLTQGMRMGMGGNPYGPAGTGKTESVKALGNLLGRQVLVFNCDEGIDVKSMNRIFVGLAKCGAWGCFDEFNRLEEAVLSALSVQIQCIQTALKTKTTEIELLGRKLDIDPNSGIFITMNPAGKGYGGRQKLPDNLKQLFRPVAMSVPDNDLIAEVLLYSEGFKYSKIIGRKLVAVFHLAKELLTPQQHYDWGLRGLKTVLQACGKLLQAAKQNALHSDKNIDQTYECELVVQALRVNTMSKLTYFDSQHFNALVKDVFSDIKFRDIGYEDLTNAIQESYSEMKLTIIDNQIKKVLELHEQLQQRIGVVVVGSSGAGKSTLWKVLKQALVKTGKIIKCYIMNPKALSRTQLLGHIDIDTREWHDGVLTSSARNVVRDSLGTHSWIICDGDIDPEWIESLNSVLDDNHLLTLPSGERIQFGQNVNFLFETDDLNNASPATISRMGIIFLSDENTDIRALVSSWLKTQPHKVQVSVEPLIEQFFFKAVDWILKQQNNFIVNTTIVGVVNSGLSHLSSVQSRSKFCLSLVKGLGSNLNKTNQEAFAKQVFSWLGIDVPYPSKVLNTYYNEHEDRLDSYTSEPKQEIQVDAFLSLTPPIVLTYDIMQSSSIIMPWLKSKLCQPIMLVGPEGCGKSVLLQYSFHQLHSVEIAIVHCSAQTTPQHVIQKILPLCITVSSHSGRLLRPKDCERLLLHLKDINLPKPDKWGTCQLVAWLQQVITYQGFYDENLEWIGLDGIQIICSFSSGTSLGKHQLSTRFSSIIRICSIDYPDDEQLKHIYSAYLRAVIFDKLKDHTIWTSAKSIEQLASSMVEILKQVKSRYSADNHSHYQFTPKDLTELVISLLRYDLNTSQKNKPVNDLLLIWTYEVCRLFRDQLVNNEERERFDSILSNIIRADWGISILDHLNDYYYVTLDTATTITSFDAHPFGKILKKFHQEDWEAFIQKSIYVFNHEVQELKVVVFKEVLNHMARVDRVLSRPGGSLLLAGVSGVGRRLAVSVMAHVHQAITYFPKVHRGYGLTQFKNDLKALMQHSAIEGKQVVMVFEDHHFIRPEFLEMINSLLASGEIPGLYSTDELEAVVNPLRNQASEEGWRGSLFSYFSLRVKRNMHIVLIMDFTSSDFSVNCESNPSLYKHCSVQWMDGWSQESMKKIPEMLLALNSGLSKMECSDDKLCGNFWKIHETCKKSIATPRRYVTFIQNFCSIHQNKKESVEKQRQHLQAGVSKLNEARVLVDSLKSEAAEQSKLLAEKQSEADDALKQITSSMSSTSDQKTEMESLKSRIEDENIKIAKRKQEIDIELAEIEPVVQEAKAAVGNIRPEALSEIRSLRAPPDVIRDILEGVLRLMGIFDTSWVSMKSFLSKRGIKEDIISFDAHKISPEIRKSVEELLKKNGESFDPKNAKRASAAAAPLASWVKANLKYSHVLEKIKPLEKEQSKLQHNLSSAEKRINKLSGALEDVEEQVIHLRNKLSKFTKEAAEIEFGLKQSKETIVSAEALVQQLDGEYHRWTKQLGDIDIELEKLPLQSLLASAFITYLSSESEDSRLATLELWYSVLGCEHFDLKQFLSNEQEQLTWKTEGLPSDPLSIENAIILLQAIFCPFLIDPSNRATDWLKNHMRERNLEVVSQQDHNFPTSIELAVRFGKTIIVQDVDMLEPFMYSLLRGDLINQGPRYVVQIGEKTVDYNQEFKLFLITKYSMLELPPYAAAIVTPVNFTTTRTGLTGQLLAAVLQNEKPELEQRRTELLQQEEDLKLQLVQLEESLLEQLASAKGNILENKDLILSLNQTKTSSLSISDALVESQKLQFSLEEERKAYLPLAQFGSKIYFVIMELNKLNNMYSFSLFSFFRLFNRALSKDMVDGTQDGRMKGLIKCFQHLVYEHVCRCLFKADRLAFAMHLIHGMYPEHFQENEWEAFTGMLVTDVKLDKDEMKSILPVWIEEERALAVTLLKNTFPSMFSRLHLDDTNLWHKFATSCQSEQDIPSSITQQLTLFQQVLLIQALRPDRLQSSMMLFGSKLLSLKELYLPVTNLRNIYINETMATEPVLIIISPGTDPSQELQELSSEIVGIEHYYQVSMGQGQMEIAIQYLQRAALEGSWVCLKNLHLVTSWLPILVKELSKLNPNENFRLWLTSEAHPNFSPILLQMCLKLTYEAPPGIKKNLLRTYDTWSQEYVNNKKNLTRSNALFMLAWFHAILQERRTYIPQGWTKFYEFNLADLRAGADIIDHIYADVDERQDIQLDFIHGLFESAIYGGRIDNLFDISILTTYLKRFFNNNILLGTSSAKRYLQCNIRLPDTSNYQEYLRAIHQMPEEDSPQYFGLPANIERLTQRTVSTQVISQLKLLMFQTEIANKFDVNYWNAELSPILNLWKKLNQGTKLLQTNVLPPNDNYGTHSPLKSFVQLEYFNGIQLIHCIHSSLAGLSKVIRGTLLLTKEIQQLATSLLIHKTPRTWQKKWEGPEDPLQYLRNVVSRALAVQKWTHFIENGRLVEEILDLADLFHPDTFLNAFRQETARDMKQSMDSLKLVSSWRGTISNSRICLRITGLQLIGCLFDGNRLADCKGDSPSISAVPPCHLAWVSKDSSSYQEDVISLPVYFTLERERVVTCIDVPSGKDKEHWLLCGAAFVLRSS